MMQWKQPPKVWLFDYDLTLYSHRESYVLQSLDRNITKFVQHKLQIAQPEADALRRDFCARYGTTLAGLIAHHQVRPEDYFDFIHNEPGIIMPPAAPHKAEWLSQVPGQLAVFTNARGDWAKKGLQAMGLAQFFPTIIDIEMLQWKCKPDPEVYELVEKKLQAQGAEIVFFEDKAENLAPAQARGWQTILVHPEIPAAHPWTGAVAEFTDVAL